MQVVRFAAQVRYASAEVALIGCEGPDTGGDRVVNQYMNFDNVGNAMQTLFAASTTEGWINTLYNTIDATRDGDAMDIQHNPAAAIFLVIYMVIVAFFLLNLFIGFVIVTYQDASDDDFEGCVLDKGTFETTS